MKRNNLLLALDLVICCLMIFSGLILLFKFHHVRGSLFLGLDKHAWKDIHIWSSILFLAFFVLHITIRWGWVKKNIFLTKKKNLEKSIRKKRRNDLWFFAFFLLTAITGFTDWFFHGRNMLTKGLHDKLGLIVIIFFIFHLIRHKYPSKRYIQ